MTRWLPRTRLTTCALALVTALGLPAETRRQERLLASLRASGVPAIGFVNQGKLCRGDETPERIAAMMRSRGSRFVTLSRALENRARALPEACASKGLSWPTRSRMAKGLPLRAEPTEPESITRLFRAPA